MESNYMPISKNFATLSIHAGNTNEDSEYACVVPPIVSSVNFRVNFSLTEDSVSQKYMYSKIANPTRNNLEQCLATLEGAKYGLCFSSGAGGLSSLLAMLKPGSHIICNNSIFGGTVVLLNDIANSFSFTTSYVDMNNIENLVNAIQPNTALIWTESISNPLMKVADIKNISRVAKERNVLLAVDNTFLTPYFHRPLELGADIVNYSLTKYFNGHCDIIMGSLLVNKKELYDKLSFIQCAMGIVPSSFDCAEMIKSLKTFALRMKQHSINAIKVARYLENHPKVNEVIHPGLPSHPQHELFKSQTSGHSGMVSFYINGDLKQTKQLLNNFKLIIPTTSFGAIESIAEIPLLISQSPVPSKQRDPKITNNLVRLSVGVENDEDIINDLDQALNSL